jgi:hypothetical protein
MNRMKTFDVPHKGLRYAFGQLSNLAGSTDYSSPTEISRLKQLGDKVFRLLSIHAKDENEVTLKHLEKRLPGASDHDRQDHELIEKKQEQLEIMHKQINETAENENELQIRGSLFYTQFNDFHSIYLGHMAEEETVTQQLLWNHFTDEELADHRREILTLNPPGTLLDWFRFVLPAQNPKERAGLIKGFKMNAPSPFFREAMDVIKEVLDPEAFERLENML